MFPEARGVEFLIIAALALIVVGPKELPSLLRKLGQFIGKMRSIADDFRTSFDEMARQSELDDLRKQVDEMRTATAAALPADPIGSDPAMQDFRRDFEAQLNDAPNYGSPAQAQTFDVEPEPQPAKPQRAPRKKAAPPEPVATATATPVKQKAAAKPQRTPAKARAAKDSAP
jgi:sec-independent protein translocase protein TatB